MWKFGAKELIDIKGVTICIGHPVFSKYMKNELRKGMYEKYESNEIEKIIQKGERILEIGAGIGFVTCVMAKNKNVEKILSYEAHPELINVIKDTLSRNNVDVNKVEIRNAVLCHDTAQETRDFYIHEDFWASSLLPMKDAKLIEKIGIEHFNKVVEDFQPTLIVCDIEGSELELFGQSNLTGVRSVFLEIHQVLIGGKGVKLLFDSFSSRNFHYDTNHSEGWVVLFSHLDSNGRNDIS